MKFHCLTHPNFIFTFSSRFDALGNKSDDKFDNQFIGGILFKSFNSIGYFIHTANTTVISAGTYGAHLRESFECLMCSSGYDGTYASQVMFVKHLHNNMRYT